MPPPLSCHFRAVHCARHPADIGAFTLATRPPAMLSHLLSGVCCEPPCPAISWNDRTAHCGKGGRLGLDERRHIWTPFPSHAPPPAEAEHAPASRHSQKPEASQNRDRVPINPRIVISQYSPPSHLADNTSEDSMRTYSYHPGLPAFAPCQNFCLSNWSIASSGPDIRQLSLFPRLIAR